MPRRLIAVHHRLAGRTGHRFAEALGLTREGPRRGFEPVVFIHEKAEPAVREALPRALPVLHDPVFRRDLGFEECTRDFVAMLRRHVEPLVRRDDIVLMTVATQREVRAFVSWLSALPRRQKPFVVFYFHSDRWNRSGDAERQRQLAEFAVAAHELARLDGEDAGRLLFGASTLPLALEIAQLLGATVHPAPLPMVYEGLAGAAAPRTPAALPPCVGFLGGARPEKGSHLIGAVIAAARGRVGARYLVHLANEQLQPQDWEGLEGLAGAPDVEVLRGGLSVEAYADALLACDLLVFPYDVTAYRQRTSGVFADGVAAGAIAVVPSGTWIGELVARGEAAGVVFDARDPIEGCAAAIAECLERLPELRVLAAAAAAPWRARHSLPAMLDWAEAGITARAEPGLPARLRAWLRRPAAF